MKNIYKNIKKRVHFAANSRVKRAEFDREGRNWVVDAARTRNRRGHIPELYQLSYDHHNISHIMPPIGIEPISPA